MRMMALWTAAASIRVGTSGGDRNRMDVTTSIRDDESA